jgi:hypothetical protein
LTNYGGFKQISPNYYVQKVISQPGHCPKFQSKIKFRRNFQFLV